MGWRNAEQTCLCTSFVCMCAQLVGCVRGLFTLNWRRRADGDEFKWNVENDPWTEKYTSIRMGKSWRPSDSCTYKQEIEEKQIILLDYAIRTRFTSCRGKQVLTSMKQGFSRNIRIVFEWVFVYLSYDAIKNTTTKYWSLLVLYTKVWYRYRLLCLAKPKNVT